MNMKAPKGTKDIMPKESGQWQYIESQFDEICRLYGFRGIPYIPEQILFPSGTSSSPFTYSQRFSPYEKCPAYRPSPPRRPDNYHSGWR